MESIKNLSTKQFNAQQFMEIFLALRNGSGRCLSDLPMFYSPIMPICQSILPAVYFVNSPKFSITNALHHTVLNNTAGESQLSARTKFL